MMRNTKSAVCALQRLKIMERVAAGEPQWKIAKEIGRHPKTVQRAIKHFLETDSRYPAGLNASTVELMRTEEFNSLDDAQAKLAQAYAKLPNPTTFDESHGIGCGHAL
jgi:IS30 family transposase